MASNEERRIGNYCLTHLLGRGGFADVYHGEHIYLQTPAAIKVLNVQITSGEHEKFLAEARIAARLDHPHIISVLEFGVEDNTPYLVMDYAANGTLRQRYPKGTQLMPQIIAPYVKYLASALQYTHDQQLVHRDVKPENMLLGKDDTILLSDFGIALVMQNTHLSDDKKRVVGTIAYMAPEQLRGESCPASDQYALAAVIYEWLCGEPLFYGSFTEVAIQHALVPPLAFRKRIPQIPEHVEEVIMIALRKEPQSRFSSIKAFAAAFAQVCTTKQDATVALAESSVLGAPSTAMQREALPKKRLSRRIITLSLLGGAGLAIGGTLAWQPLSQELPRLLPSLYPPTKSPILVPGTLLYTYHGHPTQGQVRAIVWSHDSKRIASASDSGNDVQIWYATTGRLNHIYRCGPYNNSVSIRAMAWSPNNRYIAAERPLEGDTKSEIWVWDVNTGKKVYIYHQTPWNYHPISALAWSPNSRFIASTGEIIHVWNALTGDVLTTYGGHTSPINSITWSPDGKLIASTDDSVNITNTPRTGGTVHVWEATTGHVHMIYHGHLDSVAAVAWSPNGKFIASASGTDYMPESNPDHNTVHIWKPESEKPLLIYHGHRGPVNAVGWSPDGKSIVSGGYNDRSLYDPSPLQVWNAMNGHVIRSYWGDDHQSPVGVTAVAWSPDGSMIASDGSDATVQIWKAL